MHVELGLCASVGDDDCDVDVDEVDTEVADCSGGLGGRESPVLRCHEGGVVGAMAVDGLGDAGSVVELFTRDAPNENTNENDESDMRMMKENDESDA